MTGLQLRVRLFFDKNNLFFENLKELKDIRNNLSIQDNGLNVGKNF